MRKMSVKCPRRIVLMHVMPGLASRGSGGFDQPGLPVNTRNVGYTGEYGTKCPKKTPVAQC
jgi:hypothetical protein